MIKFIIILQLFLFSFIGLFAQIDADTVFNQKDSLGREQGYWKDYWVSKDDSILAVGAITYYINGLRDSICLEFYGASQGYALMNKSRFKNDKRHGECIFYSPKGLITRIVNYKNDTIHGITKYYNLIGDLEKEFEVYNGLDSGIVKIYYSSGRLLSSSHQINHNIEHGTRKVFADTDKGELIHEYDFKNGIKIAARHYKDGKLEKEETFDYEKGLKEDEKRRKKSKYSDG